MSRVITKVLEIPYGSGATYLTATNISFDVSVFGVNMTFRLYLNGSTTGYAVLNSSAMNALYPSSTAKPFKMDHTIGAGQGLASSSPYIYLQIGGTTVQSLTGLSVLSASTYSAPGMTVSAVTGSTRSSIIRYAVHSSSAYNAVAGNSIKFTLYFYQYDCSALTSGNGVASTSISNSTPYYNDSVTYSAVVKSGATWQGWYSDEGHTNLVSNSISYTTTPNNDQTLYAYAGEIAEPPVITLGNPTLSKISDEVSINQSICTFTSSQNLDKWEARAVYENGSTNRGSGTLVESGTTLSAGSTGSIIVDFNELTNGDGLYEITIYGHSTNGYWSDGTQEVL